MKKNYIFLIATVFFIAFSLTKVDAQIQSTTGGGAWSDTLTWVGWVIPTAGDDVIINGTVDVTGAECNNLVVQEGGTVQNRSYTNYTLKVNGNVTNNGIIRNYPGWYNLRIIVAGDVINNGEWSNKYTYLVGSQDQHLQFTKEFSGYRVEDTDPASAVIADTDVTFKNTKIDLNGSELRMQQGGKLHLYGEWLYDGQISGNGSEVYMYDNAFLERVSLEKVALKGIINVYSSVVFEEESNLEDVE